MSTDSFDKNLAEISDDARRAEAVRLRQQRSDRSLAAALSGTFAGTLLELAETRAAVSIRTRSGDSIHGIVTGVGPDVVIVSAGGAQQRIVLRRLAIEAIVEQGPGHNRTVEHIDTGPELAQILDEVSAERERIALTLSTGNRIAGTILRVGIDQIALRLDGDEDTLTVPLFAIDQVVLGR